MCLTVCLEVKFHGVCVCVCVCVCVVCVVWVGNTKWVVSVIRLHRQNV